MQSPATGVITRNVTPAFTDGRGAIYDLIEDKVGHVGLITFTAGARRANHYHKESTQYSYILSGSIKLTVANIDGSGTSETILEEGMLSVIPPMVVHIYDALTDAKILDITTLSRTDDGYEKDTVRMQAE